MNLIVIALLIQWMGMYSTGEDPEKNFKDPPQHVKPWVYWINMDGHLTREGITADLEAMKEAGIGGMIYMDVDVFVPQGRTSFMSQTWKENFKHAILECERLGLEFTTISGPGWAGTGGPWISAEQSMQHLMPVSVDVKGPLKFDRVLPVPQPQVSIYHLEQTPQMSKQIEEFYEDIAVYAFPKCDSLIEDIREKAFFHREPFSSAPGTRPILPSPASYEEAEDREVIKIKEIIDLTDKLQPDGRLQWEVPEGEWTILRMGRRSTGSNTRPAPSTGLGLESDKLSKPALEKHFESYFDTLLNLIGPRPKDRSSGFVGLDHDSWEMSAQNWTEGFEKEFRKRRGYDPWPYFPAYSGRVMESREITERFLWDIRMTVHEMVLENHVGYLKELCHDRGLKLIIEPYCMNPTNCIDLGAMADIPMAEFWYNFFNTSFSSLQATSAAHLMGKSRVSAESFTAYQSDWTASPRHMKNQGDWAFAAGINHFVIVSFAHQPWLDRSPGMTFGPYGLHWERTQTFWPMLHEYHRYLARCSYMLQRGTAVSDILYLTPEGAPNIFIPPDDAQVGSKQMDNINSSGNEILPDKRGYGFDGCSPNILMKRAEVKEGRICFENGTSYQVLVLPQYETMTPELLEKIESLVRSGATIIGSPPIKSPSLSNYPQCDEAVRILVNRLWGGLEPPAILTCRKYGSGRIYWGGNSSKELYPEYSTAAEVLKEMNIPEDFHSTGPIRYTHRATNEGDLYFLSNKSAQAIQTECIFRTGKGQPELWDPLTGESRPLPRYSQENGLTYIPMGFDTHQSYFVVFAEKPQVRQRDTEGKKNFPEAALLTTLEGDWKVSFDPDWGGPEQLTFPSLQDWTSRPEEGVRYYSGIATYHKEFDTPIPSGQKIYLSLGEVHEIAEITLNGQNLGVVWCPPWQIEISDALKSKNNQLEIRVANLWVNRLIGDAAKPEEQRFAWTVLDSPYEAEGELLPSGLLGPVQIKARKE